MEEISKYYGKPVDVVASKVFILYFLLIISLIIAWLVYEEPEGLTGTDPINWVYTNQGATSSKLNIQYSFNGFDYFSSEGNDIKFTSGGAYGLDKNKENFIWIVGGTGENRNCIIYSYNGNVWVDGQADFNTILGVAYGVDENNNSRWVATGLPLSNQPHDIIYSDNGVSWEFSTGLSFVGNFSPSGYDVEFGKDINDDNLWVAVGSGDGNNSILYCDDSMSWNVSSGISFGVFNSFISGATVDYGTAEDKITKRWVAGGANNGIQTMLYSNNGISWENCTGLSFNNLCYSVAFGKDNQNNVKWVATGNGPNYILHSDDGISWQNTIGATFDDLGYSVDFGKDTTGNPLWIAVGTSSGNIIALSSFNGIEWFEANDNIVTNNLGSAIISNVFSQGVQSIF